MLPGTEPEADEGPTQGQPQPARAQRGESHSVPGVFNTLFKKRHLDVQLPVRRVSPRATAFQDSLSSSCTHLSSLSAAPPWPEPGGPSPAFSQDGKKPLPPPALLAGSHLQGWGCVPGPSSAPRRAQAGWRTRSSLGRMPSLADPAGPAVRTFQARRGSCPH